MNIHWKDWCWSWNSNTLATWCEELTHLKRLWCWERLKVGGEGDDRGWDGWMASLTQWTWVRVNSKSWWWTGRPGVLQSMGSQRVGHDWATELNCCANTVLFSLSPVWGNNHSVIWNALGSDCLGLPFIRYIRFTSITSISLNFPICKSGTKIVFISRAVLRKNEIAYKGILLIFVPRINHSINVRCYLYCDQSVQFSHSVVSYSLRPHEPLHARPPCPSPTPGVHPNPCPSSRWCHPTISSSEVPFSSCSLSFPPSGFFPVSQLLASGGQSIGVSASKSVLSMNTQDWSPLGWTGWISFQSKRLSRVFSNTTVQKHQFLCFQLSL